MKFFEKILSFSLFDFLLKRRKGRLESKIRINLGLIEAYKEAIEVSEELIAANKELIIELEMDIKIYESKIKDIEKI